MQVLGFQVAVPWAVFMSKPLLFFSGTKVTGRDSVARFWVARFGGDDGDRLANVFRCCFSDGGDLGGFHEQAFVEYIWHQGEGMMPVQAMRSVFDRDNFVRCWVARFGSEDGNRVLGVLKCCFFDGGAVGGFQEREMFFHKSWVGSVYCVGNGQADAWNRLFWFIRAVLLFREEYWCGLKMQRSRNLLRRIPNHHRIHLFEDPCDRAQRCRRRHNLQILDGRC